MSRPAALGHKQRGLRRLSQRLKAVEAGLLTVDSVHQLLAQLSLNSPRVKPNAPSALLPHQLFPLHKAVQGDHPPGHRRIVNAVIELRGDVQQMADDAAELLRRGFSGNLPAADLRA
jgi:hypothetical protein